MPDLFIGLMSGTSFDGIDAALVSFSDNTLQLHATLLHPMPAAVKQELLSLSQHTSHDLDKLCELDVKLGMLFAEAAQLLLDKSHISAKNIKAIGSHGQTLRHHPNAPYPYTLQIGDPHVIAVNTGISVVADFRRRDVALGGQGAPLAPLFHQAFMQTPTENRAIVNIGGFANVTLLPADKNAPQLGFDTGPGNVLIDAVAMQHLQQPYDNNGEFARSGKINAALLDNLLNDPFFQQAPPKSTGRDDFNFAWLEKHLALFPFISPADVQATITELTARSIINAITHYAGETDSIYICGGGCANSFLMERLQIIAKSMCVASTQKLNVDPHYVEAILFAWLAQQRLAQHEFDLRDLTGGRVAHLLGVVY